MQNFSILFSQNLVAIVERLTQFDRRENYIILQLAIVQLDLFYRFNEIDLGLDENRDRLALKGQSPF
jgi:hypothetical protein